MKRVLWVSAQAPDRNLGGINIRQAYLLDGLAGRAETDLLLAGRLDDDVTRRSLRNVTEVPVEQRQPPASGLLRRGLTLWEALVEPAPSEINALRNVRRALRPKLRHAADYDVVVIDRIELAALAPPRHDNRWVLSTANLHSNMAAHAIPLAAGPRQRWFLQRQLAKAKRYESRAARRYDAVITATADDAAAFPVQTVVVPNGVDTDRYRATPLPSEPKLVMTGSYDSLPNIEGAEWFCAEVLPKVRSRVPAVELSLVGSNPDRAVLALADQPGVTLHADVAAMPPYLEAARVSVVPVRIGSGTRLKALEAMAAGRPMVGTTIGLAGLDIVDGEHAFVRDDASTMADAIVELLTDDGRAAAMGDAGRRLVEDRFEWRAVAVQFADAVLGAISPG